MKKIDYSLSEKTKIALVSDPFGLDETVELCHNYLKIPQENPVYLHKKYFMGLFSKDLFQISDGKKGIRFWYCLKNGLAPFPKFFLALEALDSYDKEKPEEEDNMLEKLIVPKIFGYNRRSNNDIEIKKFLKGNPFKNSKGGSKEITKERVIRYSKNFKEYISKLPIEENGTPHPYIQYSISFFENNPKFKDFMERNPDRVAFLMGYSTDESHFPNYLRPILAGIDKDGKIILPVEAEEELKSEGTLLQHSWPPPPPNTEEET
jgi:hypothetical protein